MERKRWKVAEAARNAENPQGSRVVELDRTRVGQGLRCVWHGTDMTLT
jgi:hypothetical protein